MMFDPVKNPRHYAGDGEISCMDAMVSMSHDSATVLDATTIYWWLSAFKYLWRWPWKNKDQDIDKCIRCLEYMRESYRKNEKRKLKKMVKKYKKMVEKYKKKYPKVEDFGFHSGLNGFITREER